MSFAAPVDRTLGELRRSAFLMFGGAIFVTWSVHRASGRLLPAVVVGTVLATMAIGGILKPSLMRPVHRIVTILFRPLTWSLTIVVLSLIYLLVVTPIGLLRRLLSGESATAEGWITVREQPDSARHVRPW